MHGQRGIVELAGEAAIELGVFLGRDFRFRLGPDRRAVGDAAGLRAGLVDKVDRHRDRAGMLAHDAIEAMGLEIFLRSVVEMQDDARAARGRLIERQMRDGVGALAVG